MQCPNCLTENPEEARFCLNCGQRQLFTCPKCGTELPPQARSCTNSANPRAQGASTGVLQAATAIGWLQRLVVAQEAVIMPPSYGQRRRLVKPRVAPPEVLSTPMRVENLVFGREEC